MSVKETVKSYAEKVKSWFTKIGSWFTSHKSIVKAVSYVLTGIGGFFAAALLHNGKSTESIGDDLRSARQSTESAISTNQRTESNIDELKSTVGSGKSILEEVRKQKLD